MDDRWPVVLLIAAFAISCSPRGGNSSDRSGKPVGLASLPLTDGVWVFHADREWDHTGKVQFPTDSLAEAWYRPVAPGRVDTLVVSGHGSVVSIAVRSIVGQRDSSRDARLQFDFEGGRFVVWRAGADLQAELTSYGSGLPIVYSARGTLVHGP